MPEITRRMTFDSGIEQIISQDEPSNVRLPDGAIVLPGESPVENHLSSVLTPPSLEQSLIDTFRPAIEHPENLTPTGFRQAMEATYRDMERLAHQTSDPTDKKKLEAAAALLNDERSLHQLLNTYRHILHRA